MIANFIAGLFAGVWVYITLFAVGAVVGVCAWFAGRFFGVFAAAAVGAAALVAAYSFDAMDRFANERAQAEIARLEAANRAKAAKIDEITVTNAELNDFLDEERIAAQSNSDTLARVNAKLDAMEDRPDCAVPKDILDELENLR
jgi:hypothetical protein